MLTVQKVAGILRRAGLQQSTEGRNGRIGYATRSKGFSVATNGERVYTCRRCGRGGQGEGHTESCNRVRGAKQWRSRIEADGTVTVAYEYGTRGSSLRERYEALVEECNAGFQAIVAALEAEGLTVTPTDRWKATVSE